MKRLLAALAGILGIAWLRRRQQQQPPAPPVDDPADELRARLAEARDAAEARPEDDAGETPVDEAPDPGEVATRRQDVHDRARAAIDELSGGE
jgi:hypothetical protein